MLFKKLGQLSELFHLKKFMSSWTIGT